MADDGSNADPEGKGTDPASDAPQDGQAPESPTPEAATKDAVSNITDYSSLDVEKASIENMPPDPWTIGKVDLAATAFANAKMGVSQEDTLSAVMQQQETYAPYGRSFSQKDIDQSMAVASMERGVVDYAKSLSTVDPQQFAKDVLGKVQTQLDDMTPMQRINVNVPTEKSLVAQAEKFNQSLTDFQSQALDHGFQDFSAKGRQASIDTAVNIGQYQPNQVAQAKFGGYTDQQIASAMKTSPQDVIGTLLSMNPAQVFASVGKMVSPDLEGKLAFSKMANPTESLGVIGQVLDKATSLLGEFAMPAKFALDAVGMLMSPTYTDFSKGPVNAGVSAPDGNTDPMILPIKDNLVMGQKQVGPTQQDIDTLLKALVDPNKSQNPQI